MQHFNFLIIPLAALVPLVVGAVWYNPAVFGKTWIKAAEISEERSTSGNMIKIFALTYLFSLFAAYLLSFATVHQLSVVQLFFMDPALADPSSEFSTFTADYMERFGSRHRSFGHGVIHGVENGLLFSLAMIGIPALFERRSWKYTLVHVGFWALCFGLMGGILCQFV